MYHYARFYTNISTNISTTNIFPFFSIFALKFCYFPPNFEPIQIDFIAYIVSKVMNSTMQNFMLL